MQRKLAIVAGLVLMVAVWAAPAAADPGRGAQILCYLWANNASPSIGVPYTPSTTYSYNTFGRATVNSVTKTSTGTYTAKCSLVGGGAFTFSAATADAEVGSTAVESVESVESMAGEAAVSIGEPDTSGSWGPGGHVQVTAYGSEDADHCKVSNWTTGGAHFTAIVRCYNHAGGLADNRFDLLFIW